MKLGFNLLDKFTVSQRISQYVSWPRNLNTVKPAHAVTSIKQPAALKGHILFVLS